MLLNNIPVNNCIITYTNAELDKYKRVEQLIISCALGKSNISNNSITYELVSLRLNNLRPFINQVIRNNELNILLHNFIDSIINNPHFKSIYANSRSN